MHCPNCHAEYAEEDMYCHQCGADVVVPSTSIIAFQKNLPALLHYPQLPRKVAAGVGAVALGFGVELLRRGLVARLTQPSVRAVEPALPNLVSLKDALLPTQAKKTRRSKKGYEVEETVVYLRRITRH